jgi:CHAD domain-containing protein
MTTSYIERELKFDVGPGFQLPPLDEMLPPGGRIEVASQHLRSEYFDTDDHALLHAQMTLRRRTGSTDVGWQLKVPHEPFREEIRIDLDAADNAVPEELAGLLLGVRAGRELVRVATVTTERSVTTLMDADGQRLAEIDDDNVHASAPANEAESVTLSTWREVEVELESDEVELLKALGKRLRRGGARPSAFSSKLAKALPDNLTAGTRRKKKELRASDVVMSYIADQHRAMLAGDLALRRGDDSVIHKTRVAVRRLRSALRVFNRYFDGRQVAALDVELRWYAALLGAVRDRQVLRERLDTMVADIDDILVMGPVRARIDTELRQEQAQHWERLLNDMGGDRYLTLMADLTQWVRRPSLTAAARGRARSVATLEHRADVKVTRQLRRANTRGDLHLLHAARKAAKRARYAAELAEPVLGAKVAAKRASKYRTLQDLLGEHQDSLLSAELLRRLGANAGTTPGENGFAFGILHEREERRARKLRAKARAIADRYAKG